MPHRKQSLTTHLLIGIVGGLTGTVVMDQIGKAMYQREDPRTQEYEERVRHRQYPPELAAEKAVKLLTGQPPKPEITQKLAKPIHFSTGAAMGLVFAAVSRRSSFPIFTGIAFGIAAWAAFDEIGMPAMGLSPDSRKFPWQNHVRSLAAHVVYGGTLGATQALLRKVA